MPGRRYLSLVAFVFLVSATNCKTADTGGKKGLPLPRPDNTSFSDYQPDSPFLPASSAGVAQRKVFQTDSGEGYDVSVEDFLISPKSQTAVVPLGAPAVVEVREGSGTATAGERRVELAPGTVFTVSAGESLSIATKGETIALRTWIVRTH